MQKFAVANPDYSVAWHGQALDALRALDAFAEAEGFSPYSYLIDPRNEEELDPDGNLICQLDDGQIWAIFTNYSVTPMQTEFLLRVGDKLYVPRVAGEYEMLVCPVCNGSVDGNQWAHDGEADLADWFHCPQCNTDGGLVQFAWPNLTQNGLLFDLEVKARQKFVTPAQAKALASLIGETDDDGRMYGGEFNLNDEGVLLVHCFWTDDEEYVDRTSEWKISPTGTIDGGYEV